MTFTVLLSVYAKESSANFNRSFYSIWDSQELKPEQIILVKDGPLSEELELAIDTWMSKLGDVLTIVPLPDNVGLASALNEGLKYCRHDLIARMDTDDIAMPKRFAIQLEFMDKNPDIAASSGCIEELDDSGNIVGLRKLPLDHAEIVHFAKRRSPLSHPAAMFRKEAVLAVGGYPLFRNAQDYALWSLLIVRGYKLANLSDTLVKMRTGSDMYKRRGLKYLKMEIGLLNFQHKIGFISRLDFLINAVSRAVLRISPVFLKKALYLKVR